MSSSHFTFIFIFFHTYNHLHIILKPFLSQLLPISFLSEFLQLWKTYGKKVTKDRADSMYDVIINQASDGRIKQKAPLQHINEETLTTKL